ncbi:STAS domain protein [Necator americanus]|uniref:STAS domain protein n=1 Tax=Necator americanus TaxID=51031 RepID=W2T4X9_NECAM|nr:STAS domain protein [Necator americanus]ETN76017.1 STAS domain protein [Necator americanus]
MGFTSMISGFFPVFPHSSSLSRTMVSVSAGTKTQSIWVVAFVATVAIDVMQGLAIAILFALFTTSVCVLRFDSPLLFTNVERFRKIVDKLAKDWDGVKCCGKIDKRHLIPGEKTEKHEIASNSSHTTKKYLIIDCSGFAYVDVMGVNGLKEIYEEMKAKNIQVSFAAAKAPVRELFEASGLYATVAKTNFYPTIYDAVSYAQLEKSTLQMDEVVLHENSYANSIVNTTDETFESSDTSNGHKSVESSRTRH